MVFCDDEDDRAWELLADPALAVVAVLAQLPNVPDRILDRVVGDPTHHVVLARNEGLAVERLRQLDCTAKVAVELAGNCTWFAAHRPDPAEVAAALASPGDQDTPGALLDALGLDCVERTGELAERLARAVFANEAAGPAWTQRALAGLSAPMFAAVTPTLARMPGLDAGVYERVFVESLAAKTRVRQTLSANASVSPELAASMALFRRSGFSLILANPQIGAELHADALRDVASLDGWDDGDTIAAVASSPLTPAATAIELARCWSAAGRSSTAPLANPNLTVADLADLAGGSGGLARKSAAELRLRGEWAGHCRRWSNVAADHAWELPADAPAVTAGQLTAIVELAATRVTPAEAVAASALM